MNEPILKFGVTRDMRIAGVRRLAEYMRDGNLQRNPHYCVEEVFEEMYRVFLNTSREEFDTCQAVSS